MLYVPRVPRGPTRRTQTLFPLAEQEVRADAGGPRRAQQSRPQEPLLEALAARRRPRECPRPLLGRVPKREVAFGGAAPAGAIPGGARASG